MCKIAWLVHTGLLATAELIINLHLSSKHSFVLVSDKQMGGGYLKLLSAIDYFLSGSDPIREKKNFNNKEFKKGTLVFCLWARQLKDVHMLKNCHLSQLELSQHDFKLITVPEDELMLHPWLSVTQMDFKRSAKSHLTHVLLEFTLPHSFLNEWFLIGK